MNDIEVEIKVPITQQEFGIIKDKVAKIAKHIKTISQEDDYYIPKHRNFLDVKYPFEWLRVGLRGDKFLLNYKHYHPENAKDTTHADEYETVIENKDQLEKIFKALDIKKIVSVNKQREVYMYQDKFEIALDTVEKLGCFIEIEAKGHNQAPEEVRKLILDFARKLGIDLSKEDKRGYPYLLLKRLHLLPRED